MRCALTVSVVAITQVCCAATAMFEDQKHHCCSLVTALGELPLHGTTDFYCAAAAAGYVLLAKDSCLTFPGGKPGCRVGVMGMRLHMQTLFEKTFGLKSEREQIDKRFQKGGEFTIPEYGFIDVFVCVGVIILASCSR